MLFKIKQQFFACAEGGSSTTILETFIKSLPQARKF